jgi:hypothetical protein
LAEVDAPASARGVAGSAPAVLHGLDDAEPEEPDPDDPPVLPEPDDPDELDDSPVLPHASVSAPRTTIAASVRKYRISRRTPSPV